MSGNQHRQIKKREKQRKKRTEAQERRGSRRVMGLTADRLETARNWPLWDCWASENWHEQGAHVHACFARRHDDGTVAASFFELDLAERGVVEAHSIVPATTDQVLAELSKLGKGETSMVGVDPNLVVKLVDTAQHHGEKQGHAPPSNLSHARRVFGSAAGHRCKEEIRVGKPDPNAPKAPPKTGWLASIKKSIGLG